MIKVSCVFEASKEGKDLPLRVRLLRPRAGATFAMASDGDLDECLKKLAQMEVKNSRRNWLSWAKTRNPSMEIRKAGEVGVVVYSYCEGVIGEQSEFDYMIDRDGGADGSEG